MMNPRQAMWRFLAVAAFCLLSLLQAGPAAARTEPAAADYVPDVALVVSGVDDGQVARAVTDLGTVAGVLRATVATGTDAPTATGEPGTAIFYLALDADGADARSPTAVADEAADRIVGIAPEAEIAVGGSAVVDDAVSGRFRRSALAVAALAFALGCGLSVVFGWKRGLMAGLALGLAVVVTGTLGAQVGGEFDGRLATTALPGALAGLVTGLVVVLRMLMWFRAPSGTDGGDTIRRAVGDLVPELALVLSGLFVSALVVELLNSGRSTLTVVAVSATVAAVVVAAIMAPALTVLERQAARRPGWLPLAVPDGRDFPLLALSAVAAVLIALSVFAFGQPDRSLMGHGHLAENSRPAVVAERLRTAGGDATSALVALKPDAATQVDFEGWAGAVVERPEVEWVDVASGRLTSTGPIEVAETSLLMPPGREGAAIIVLNVSPRSVTGQEVIAGLAAIPLAGGPPTFEGDAARAAGLAGTVTPLVVAVIALAVAAAIAVYVVTQSIGHAASALVLRLIGGGAALGLFRLMVSDATLAESMTVLSLLALALGLYELEFVRELTDRSGSSDGEPAPVWGEPWLAEKRSEVAAEPNPGQFGGFGLLVLGLAGVVVSIMALFGGGPGTGQFGLGLLAVVTVELVVGVMLLRPALLGQHAAFHTAARPVRIAIHSGLERQAESRLGAEDPTWRRVVGDLLQAEFRLQSEPATADLDAVFVRDTPLYRQAATHHRNLAAAGLRIVGRSPQLRSLKTVSGRTPITLAVTVDHPERQLVNGDGTVVGIRKPERRSGVLWLSVKPDGSCRIAESVELGSVPLPTEAPVAAQTDTGDASGSPHEHLAP